MKSYWWPAYVQNCMTSCEFLLLQDCQVVVLGTQLVSAAFGGLQLGVQLSFDLQRNTVTLSVQQSVSLRLHVLQVPVQSLGILRLSHCQTCEMTPVWRSTLEDLTEYLAAMNDRSVRSTNTTTEGCVFFGGAETLGQHCFKSRSDPEVETTARAEAHIWKPLASNTDHLCIHTWLQKHCRWAWAHSACTIKAQLICCVCCTLSLLRQDKPLWTITL